MIEVLKSDSAKVVISKKVFDNFPEYAVCYLAYGDKSGLSEEDIENCNRFLKDHRVYGDIVDFVFENKGFCSRPCFGLACECITAIFSHVVEVQCFK